MSDTRLDKVCPVCKAAPGGKCLEANLYGSKYIEQPHPQRYAAPMSFDHGGETVYPC